MRTFLIGAAALLIAASTPAYADNNKHQGAGGGGRAATKVHEKAGHPAKVSGGVRVESAHRPAPHAIAVHRGHVSVHRGHVHHARGHRPRVVVRRAPPVAARVDVSRLHRVFHSYRRYHAGIYNRPYGWYSYDWRVGQRLPRAWFAREYWVGDWGMYGLFTPPDGLIWVRVGPDALLINADTGEVVTVYNDLFW